MPTIRTVLAGAALCALAVPAAAGIITVPQDQSSIQAGVDAAQSGDTVLISAGTYNENVVLNARSGLTLQAKGKVVIDLQQGALPAFALNACDHIDFVGLRVVNGGGDGIDIVDSSVITLTSCGFEQLLAGGLHATGSDGVSCVKCSAKSVTGTAFAFSPDPGDTPCNDVTVQKCSTSFCTSGAIVRGNAPLLDSNKIVHPVTTGLGLLGSSAGVVSKNKITQLFGGVGLRIGGTDGGTEITDNVVTGSGAGFDLDTAQQTNLRRNKVSTGDFGAILNNCSNCLAEQNKISASSNLVVQGCDHIDLTGNTIKGDNTGPGIALTVSDSCTLTDNKLSKVTGAIVILGDSDAVTGGLVSHAIDGVSMDDGCTLASVTGVTITGCSGTGLTTAGSGATVSNCKILHAKGDGLRVTGTGGTIDGNLVSKSGASGVHLLAGSAGNTLSTNVAKGSKDFDLLDESSGANTVQPDNQFETTSP